MHRTHSIAPFQLFVSPQNNVLHIHQGLKKRVLPLIQQRRNTSEKKEPSTDSSITEIRKYKELLDEGLPDTDSKTGVI